MEFEKKACPDCNGSGVYQEYDEYDRYTVHSCATCDGSGEIARQSVKSEEVAEAIRQTPMKPKIDGEFGLCQRCGYVFNSELISAYCVNYCPSCGQKLDWSEE